MKPIASRLIIGVGLLTLAACGDGAPPVADTGEDTTKVPEEIAEQALPDAEEEEDGAQSLGTPLEDRVVTLGLINKRNNQSIDVEMKPGESRRIDDVVLRLSSCEKTAPWEDPAETGAFVQVLINDRPDADSDAVWTRVFSGWLFKNSPALNVVEHPVYDVWVKDCAMSFPGEEEPSSSASSTSDE